MFESLTERLSGIFKKLRGQGKLKEADVTEALREVRMALLEADVHLSVAKDFVVRVKEKAVGAEVLESLTPAQAVIKIVNEELVALMGKEAEKVIIASQPPTTIMMVGLQGSGKTTSSGKLALYFKDQGKRPLLVAADIYRPAAIKQLQVLGSQIGIPVFSMGSDTDPVVIAKSGMNFAKAQGHDIVILDTAGRLHVDEEMMEELRRIKAKIAPTEILLVLDSMMGQDAVTLGTEFDKSLSLTGVVLTKLDGDARGGAALSVRAVTGKPIKLVGMGEKLTALEVFHPDRMASRILGMGDVLSLIERVEANLDASKALDLEEKLRKEEFTLEDYLDQLRQVRKMGPLDEILSMLPAGILGGGKMARELKDMKVDESELVRIEAIISSMTREERVHPSLIGGSRKRRIAKGSGTTPADVNQVLRNFEQTRKIFKQVSDLGKGKRKGMRLPFWG